MKPMIKTMTQNQKARRSLIGALVAILAIVTLIAPVTRAATGSLAPSPVFTGFDNNGNPLSGGLLSTFIAGTTTPIATYTDVGLSVANANPIVLDSAGRAVIFLSPGQSYKFVLKTSASVTVWTQDNIAGGPGASSTIEIAGTAGEALGARIVVYLSDGSGAKTAGRWYIADPANTYSSTLPVIGMTTGSIGSGAVGTFRLNGIEDSLAGLVAGTTYYVTAAGALTSAAPVNARIVGQADTSTSLVLDTTLSDRPPIVQTTTATGTQNDFTLTPGVRVLRANNASGLTFTGFSPGFDGQRLTVVSVGAGDVGAVHQSGSSTAADRLVNFATSVTTGVSAGTGNFEYQYDLTTARWRLLSHEQGTWQAWTPAWKGSGGQSGQVYSLQSGRFYLKGRTVAYNGRMTLTTLGTITGTVQIGTFPYPVATAGSGINTLTVLGFSNLTTAVVSMAGFMPSGTALATPQMLTAAATSMSTLVQANLANTTDFTFSGFYETE